MPPPARLLLVVPCLNEAAALPGLLTWLVSETGAESLIVVADGGSSDTSVAIVEDFAERHPAIRLLRNPKRLQSAAVNLAAETFGDAFDWMVRIDAHCGYPAGYVDMLLAAAAQHDAISVVVPMVTKGEACFQSAAAAAQNSVMGTGGSPHRHLVAGRYVDHGHHALFDLAAFRAAGGYDETFSHNEDAELDHRLGLAGGRIWLEPGAALIYHPRRTGAQLLRQYWNYGRGRARTVRKHGLRLKPRQAAPLVIAPCVVLAVLGILLALVDIRFLLLAAPAVAWFALCQLFAVRLALRARSWCTLASGVAAMLMHLGWSAGFWSSLLGAGRVVRPQSIR